MELKLLRNASLAPLDTPQSVRIVRPAARPFAYPIFWVTEERDTFGEYWSELAFTLTVDGLLANLDRSFRTNSRFTLRLGIGICVPVTTDTCLLFGQPDSSSNQIMGGDLQGWLARGPEDVPLEDWVEDAVDSGVVTCTDDCLRFAGDVGWLQKFKLLPFPSGTQALIRALLGTPRPFSEMTRTRGWPTLQAVARTASLDPVDVMST